MGNSFDKCKTYLTISSRREIITERSLKAICKIVDYLKLNVQNRNVFRDSAYRRRIRQISAYIASGNKNIQNYIMERGPIEVAAGLQYYLIRLPKPLIPQYIQDLALDLDTNIQPEIVAADMLGLIRQDLKGRHLLLVLVLMDLLLFLKKHALSDELSGSSVPVTLLPVFFILQPRHLPNWRHIANIFMEMVELSPTFFPNLANRIAQSNVGSSSERIEQNLLFDDFDALLENENISEDLFDDDENVILHQILIRSGSEGDANFTEIVNVTRIRQETYPKLLNPTLGYYRRRFR